MTRQPIVITAPDALAADRSTRPGQIVGLVPTMGALHEGHLSLIRRAASECDVAVVSVFVNPAQFGDPADLERYPRTFDQDLELAGAAGAAIVYAPAVATMYPEGFTTKVHVNGVTDRWEGESRPGHFDGVATVVTILLNQVQPDRSYFGEKDAQQLVMIRRLHADLALPGCIVACPVVREANGLALSSRNARLSDGERQSASLLSTALNEMKRAVSAGATSALKVALIGAIILRRDPAIAVDYLQVVHPETLEPLDDLVPGARAIVAATIGGTRLIDTMVMTPGEIDP